MTHKLDRENIFNFFKAESFIQEIHADKIIIEENRESATLKKFIITSLDKSSKYWLVDTESNAFQLQGKKVENIILEQTEDDVLNIMMIELKSGRVRDSEVQNKFKNSLTFIYILLHLLRGKDNQEINVFGILVAQIEKNWNEKNRLNILSSTSIRYIKRSFFTQESKIEIVYQELIKTI